MKQKNTGLTLVEILVSTALLVIITVSLFYVLRINIEFQNDAVSKTRAAFTIQSKMEELKGLSFAEVKMQNDTTFDYGKGEIKVTAVDLDLLELRTVLYWGFNKKPIQLYSLRAR